MKEKGLLIGMLCTVIVVMAVAFAAFSTTLTINGTATISSDWEVAFDASNSSCSDEKGTVLPNTVDIDGTIATLDVDLVSPGDTVTCNLTVKNTGSLDAKLSSITVTPSGDAPITFTVTPTTEDLDTRAVLAAETGTETITVAITYDEDTKTQPAKVENTVVVKATYNQHFTEQASE